MRCLRLASGASVLGALVALQSCCDDYELGVPDLGGRMSFGADVAFDFDFDWDMQIDWDFDLDLRWAGWSNIRWASDFNIDIDLSGMLAFETETDQDIDDDGVAEKVRLLAFSEDDPADPYVVFAAWKGDKYSFDEGRCYLLWQKGDTVELLSAACDKAEPALHCVMTRGKPGSLQCDACNQYGVCAECNAKGSVSSCVKEGQALPKAPPVAEGGAAGSVGEAGQPAVAGQGGASSAGAAGQGGSAQSENGGAPAAGGNASTGGSVTVTAEWSLCVEQVSWLAGQARGCSMPELLDTDVLCSDRLSDVNICYVAAQAVGLFGSTCTVLEENLTCGGLFP